MQTHDSSAPRLLNQVRDRFRREHYRIRTEEAYVHWVKVFVRFHGLKHPASMGAAEVESFLTHLAVERHVSSSTQNQAHRSPVRTQGPPSCRPAEFAAANAAGRSVCGHRQARDAAHTATFVCNTFARIRLRHSLRPGAARPRGRADDDDLQACAQSWWARREESAGPGLVCCLAMSGCQCVVA